MKTTLISAIGRGQKDSVGRAYRKTEYRQGELLLPPTAFFVDAWLNSPEAAKVDRVELIGTATSTWSALVEDLSEGQDGLYCQLEERCGGQDSAGVAEADLKPLAEILARRWQRSVRCHVLCQREVDDTNASDLLDRLLRIFPLDEPERAVQLDTTHGFRTLPLLALSAVQIADSLRPGFALRTRLIYGEWLGKEGRAIAFDSVLKNLRLSRALARFFDTLDASDLALELKSLAPKLAAALEALSICLQANTLDRVSERLCQLRNSLPEGAGGVLGHIANELRRFAARLEADDLPRRLFALAGLRAERGQFGLAILALAEAATALASPRQQDNFEAMKEAGRSYGESLPRLERGEWDFLFQMR
ncbi:MAG: CRISPR-associated DxTHG motif protein, partial [Planctomycetes bacterium]|nr:CRISPR-associated DxTHG motif protein [Planctomycetota bacterium]